MGLLKWFESPVLQFLFESPKLQFLNAFLSQFYFLSITLINKFFLSDIEFWILKFDCIFPKVYQMSYYNI